MTTNLNETKLTKSDLRKVFMRSYILDNVWNYERQQNLMYCYSMILVLKRLYGNDEEKMADALRRYLEFMSCTPHPVALLVGTTGAMEEENAKDENFDAVSIGAVKTSLMGPMAGIGDAFFWGILLAIAIGISISFAKQGSIIGPIAFLLTINIPDSLARYYCLYTDFKYGVKFFGDSENSRMTENITKAASIPGLMVIGAMIASTVSTSIPFEIGIKDVREPIQTYTDRIMSCLPPLTVLGIMCWLLGKNVRTTVVLVCPITLACIGTFFGLL